MYLLILLPSYPHILTPNVLPFPPQVPPRSLSPTDPFLSRRTSFPWQTITLRPAAPTICPDGSIPLPPTPRPASALAPSYPLLLRRLSVMDYPPSLPLPHPPHVPPLPFETDPPLRSTTTTLTVTTGAVGNITVLPPPHPPHIRRPVRHKMAPVERRRPTAWRRR